MSRRGAGAVARTAVPGVSGLVALAGVLADVGAPVQPVIVFWFVLVCPGLALVDLVRPPSLLVAATLSVTVSCAVGITVAEVLLYAGWWSPVAGLLVLVVLTLGATGVRLRSDLRADRDQTLELAGGC